MPTKEVLNDYTTQSGRISKLIADWGTEEKRVFERRKLRKNRKNVADMRERGELLHDETIICDRTIDRNIRQDRIPIMEYVTQSDRLLVITDLNNPKHVTTQLEDWFTTGMRYPRWRGPWNKLADGIQLHGGVAAEIVYDPLKPFNVSVEYIRREDLILPEDTKDLQACSHLVRKYTITPLQLREFEGRFKFDPEVVQQLITKNAEEPNRSIDIYRVLLKRQGIVHNAWYAEQQTKWLRAPVRHEIGLFDFDKEKIAALAKLPSWNNVRKDFAKPMPLKLYPIFWFPFEETEEEKLLEVQGRAALDIHTQEALTHLLTNTVNASTRASNFYPSVDDGGVGDEKPLEVGRLKPGMIMNRKIVHYQPPWPNSIITAIVQILDLRKAQEMGRSDFAALARKDANKTATEMNLAQQATSKNALAGLGVFSSPYLDVYALAFEVAVHQAIFLLAPPPPNAENLFGNYNLQPAGDIEVIKRAEEKENAKEFFALVQGTPIAEKILILLLQRFFPDHAEEWVAALQTPEKDAIIAQLLQVLQNVPVDDLNDEQRSQLQLIISQAQAVVGIPNDPGRSTELPEAEGAPAQ